MKKKRSFGAWMKRLKENRGEGEGVVEDSPTCFLGWDLGRAEDAKGK